VLYLGQLAIFMAALAGIGAASLGMIYFAGRAANRSRPVNLRRLNALLAGLCVFGIALSAGAGFFGVGALLYVATR